MHRFIFLFYIFFNPVFSFAQKDTAKARALFKVTEPLFEKLLNFNVTNRDSALIINKKLIAKLEEVYTTDTSNVYVGFYLMNCYKIEGNLPEVIKWAKNQLLYCKNPNETADFHTTIVLAYMSLGEFDSSKTYIVKIMALEKKNISYRDSLLYYQTKDLITEIKKRADSIYTRPSDRLIKLLPLKGISPCEYAIQILNYIQPYTKIYFDKILFKKAKNEITVKQENCK